MNKYIADIQGKWLVKGRLKILIEPSEHYLAERELEQQLEREKELIESLIPSKEEILKAETELQIINILQEGNLI